MLFFRKIAAILFFLSLLSILVSTYMLTESLTPVHWKWGVYGSCLVLFLSSINVVLFRQESSEKLLLKFQQRKIEEEEDALQQLQSDIKSRYDLLVHKEKELKQKFMQYEQYAEFPDDKTTSVDKGIFDEEIAELLHDKAEIIFDNIVNNKYIERS